MPFAKSQLVMSPDHPTAEDNSKVVMLIPNRTDYQLWLVSLMNSLTIQGLNYYIDIDAFGKKVNMRTASKEEVTCVQNMSKCFR